MVRYRKCGGCHIPAPYCDCSEIELINYDIKAATPANLVKPAYIGGLNFGYSIRTYDGYYIDSPQFQAIGYDGTYVFVSVCDKNDEDGCIIRFTWDNPWGYHVGPKIEQIGHAKLGVSFEDQCIYIARRVYNGDWGDKVIIKIDRDTLAEVSRVTGEHQITGFVQHGKELYCIDSDGTHFYKFSRMDMQTGVYSRDLIATLKRPGDYYDVLAGPSTGLQAWAFDGRTVMSIRNNPQTASFYDIITKKDSIGYIGDVSDGRWIGEIEGAYVWDGVAYLVSANDIADTIKNTAQDDPYADIYLQFWTCSISGGAGSADTRENTHPTYSVASKFWPLRDETALRNIRVSSSATNFYCNGSKEFPFHSLHEALAYLRYHPTAKGIQIDNLGNDLRFLRLFNTDVDISYTGSGTLPLRITDCQHCRLTLSHIQLHDSDFTDCDITLTEGVTLGTSVYDTYFNWDTTPPAEVTKGGKNNVWKRTMIKIGKPLSGLDATIINVDLLSNVGIYTFTEG